MEIPKETPVKEDKIVVKGMTVYVTGIEKPFEFDLIEDFKTIHPPAKQLSKHRTIIDPDYFQFAFAPRKSTTGKIYYFMKKDIRCYIVDQVKKSEIANGDA